VGGRHALPLFPYTTLFRSEAGNVGRHYYEWRYGEAGDEGPVPQPFPTSGDVRVIFILADPVDYGESEGEYVDIRNYADWPVAMGDRKSTRLNSSHVKNSYA